MSSSPPSPEQEARFRALFEQHGDAVLRYARRRTTSAIADDIVAETFLVAWRRLEHVPAEPRGWLLGVARRVLANQWRADRRRAELASRLALEVPAAVEGLQSD